MELKPGTDYRRRDGRKARYHGVSLLGTKWGAVEDSYGSFYTVYRDTGRQFATEKSSADLIDEWREPRTATCKRDFVLVECPHESAKIVARIEGSECSRCRILGRKTIEVSITEGEGVTP